MLYKVLITLHLDRAVTAYAFVADTLVGIVEGVHAQIQHPEGWVLIGENVVVHRPFIKKPLTLHGCDEMD